MLSYFITHEVDSVEWESRTRWYGPREGCALLQSYSQIDRGSRGHSQFKGVQVSPNPAIILNQQVYMIRLLHNVNLSISDRDLDFLVFCDLSCSLVSETSRILGLMFLLLRSWRGSTVEGPLEVSCSCFLCCSILSWYLHAVLKRITPNTVLNSNKL